jgi:uncharacterized damage-inducible protein DinB
LKTIRKMYEHLHWANQRILTALQGIEEETCLEATRLFGHILFAEKIWVTRLQGLDSSRLPIWPEADIEAMQTACSRKRRELYWVFI